MEKWARINYQPCMPIGKNGKRVTGSKAHANLARKAACEGIVLLKNENQALPLKKGSKIAIFGKAQFDYVKGGGGSGDVYSSYTVNVYNGLKSKGYNIFEELSSYYNQYVQSSYQSGSEIGNFDEADVPFDVINKAKEFTNTAIITICRHSKEGEDYKVDGKGFNLTQKELDLIDAVKENFSSVIAIINTGNLIDVSWFYSCDKIKGAIMAWQGGLEGGNAIADIISGDVNPSGKLVDTIAKSINDYPSTKRFYQNNDITEYDEDVFVGYRYFETIKGKKDRVYYPFGYGLSYTTFEFSDIKSVINKDTVKVQVTVKNVGAVSGKEVVQLYYKAPNGKISKPAINLCAFTKTRLLKPFSSQTVTLSFKISNMASFDDVGAIKKSAYVLEKGKYELFIGNSIRNVKEVNFDFYLDNNVTIKQLSSLVAPRNLTKRLLSSGEYVEAINSTDPIKVYPVRYTIKENYPKSESDIKKLIEVVSGNISLDEFISQLTSEEMFLILHNRLSVGVANTGGIGGGLYKYGIPSPMSTDGPAGVRILPKTGISTTAFPIATMLACTFNLNLIKNVGKTGAKECIENNLSIWLTPGLNIHRSPLCGRNFEYYSEDPLISGKMASAMVKGIQSENIVATPKHFACNNKETNRLYAESAVSERALREIYLKGFEICIKEAKPKLLMTAYNKLNGCYASENGELLTGILRKEWGYKGLIVSDWANKACHKKELLAGNDIKIFYYCKEVISSLPRKVLARSVKKLLEMILWLD